MTSNNFVRVVDTTVSGSSLFSNVDGDDWRTIEFGAAMHSPPAVVMEESDVGPPIVGNTLTAEEWMQAAISTLPLDASGLTVRGDIVLGEDTAEQASAYINFFNLRSLDDVRILRMHLATPIAPQASILMSNSSGATFAHVQVNGSAPAGVLFQSNLEAGIEYIIHVNALNLTLGSEVVNFSLLVA